MIQSAAPSDKTVIENLMQDYLGELSGFTDDLSQSDGRYRYPYLSHYWDDPERYPFLITLDNQPVGFVLVRKDRDPGNGSERMEVAEFFVTEDNRRNGLGTRCALKVFGEFPGRWRVCVLTGNKPAHEFWRDVIRGVDPEFTEDTPSLETNDQTVFHLTSFS